MPPADRPGSGLAEAGFDGQAGTFDVRAGLPDGVARAIARALLGLRPPGGSGLVVDVGAGTGEIGVELARVTEYVALDASAAMLDAFRDRATRETVSATLVVADARDPWPVPDGAASLVFGSRSLHWIAPEHLLREARRVAAPRGCAVVIGRVERDPGSAREQMRRWMRQRLREEGYGGRHGGRHAETTVELAVAGGAAPLPPVEVARWTRTRSLRASLDDWAAKAGLGGASPPPDVKRRILDGLAHFTAETFGNIDAPHEFAERYVLRGVRLDGPG